MKPKQPPTLSIRINPELKAKLQAEADKSRRTLSNYVALELEKLTENKEKQGK
jgi:predicted transcriptional regulator